MLLAAKYAIRAAATVLQVAFRFQSHEPPAQGCGVAEMPIFPVPSRWP
jgi:hypothetical protein